MRVGDIEPIGTTDHERENTPARIRHEAQMLVSKRRTREITEELTNYARPKGGKFYPGEVYKKLIEARERGATAEERMKLLEDLTRK